MVPQGVYAVSYTHLDVYKRQVAHTAQIQCAASASRQVVREVSDELVLDVLRADGMLEAEISPVLRQARMRPDETEWRIAVIGHQLGPCKAG